MWQTASIATLTSAAIDFLGAHSPALVAPVAPAVQAARAALETAGHELVTIPDHALERGWLWRDDEADVRYGLYRGIESIEEAAAHIAGILAAPEASDTGSGSRSAAARRIAPATAARWALHGHLAPLDDRWLDRHPRAEEWSIREILAHVVAGQRAYAAFTAWWFSQPPGAPPPDRVLDDVQTAAALPDEEEEGSGTLAEIRARFDEVLDRGAAHLAGLSDADLARPARWAGIPVDVGFRLGRWSSHVIEHTIQLDKTLDWLNRRPTEVERIVLDLYAAWVGVPGSRRTRSVGRRRPRDPGRGAGRRRPEREGLGHGLTLRPSR